MIIELKGLPKQKIKKINFNIEFDDYNEDEYEINISSPVSQAKQTSINTHPTQPIKNIQNIQNTSEQEDLPKIDNIISDISERAPKEIPAEMLEESF